MLLHANVDRLLAMWQAIYPDSYLLPATSSPTFTIPDHGAVDENTPLAPFTSGDGQTAYTAATSRYLKTFGHSYPEIQDWNQTPEELKANVTAQMNALYNPGGIFTTTSKRSYPPSMRTRQSDLEVGQTRQWSVTSQILNSDLKAPLLVHVFLGNPPTDATGWSEAVNLVGSMIVRPLGRAGEVVVAHEFSLHHLLRKAGIDPEDVASSIAYLKANLSWGVQEVITPQQVQGYLDFVL